MENILGIKPIPKLLRQFALPSIISMLVNSVYNMVDQIFIGQKIGYLGNGATNMTFPFVTVFLAIGLMISIGTAANVGLNLGRKNQERADRTLGNGLMLAVTAGLILVVIAQIFLVPLLKAFGATEIILPYAVDYARIYTVGTMFVMIGIVVNDEIRADGNPRYAMISMLFGAILNVILDYVLIFPLEMGVAGAALASIIGQFLTMIVALLYLRRFRTLNLRLKNLKPNPVIIRSIFILGLPSFATQIAGLAVQVIMNNQAVRYGTQSAYGPEIPLAVLGISMKIIMIMMSLIMGTAIGAQPIFSFNYGAEKYDRVKQLIRICIIVTTMIGVIGVLAIQIFPAQIMAIFGQEDPLYREFAVRALKRMTILAFVMGVQMTANSYFQAVGKPKLSMLVSLSRQVLFMVPLMLILPAFFGLDGIMYSFILSDAGSAVMCSILLAREIKELKALTAKPEASSF